MPCGGVSALVAGHGFAFVAQRGSSFVTLQAHLAAPSTTSTLGPRHDRLVRALALSPTTRIGEPLLASCPISRTILLTSLTTRAIVARFPVPVPIWSTAWDSDVPRILWAGGQNGRLFAANVAKSGEAAVSEMVVVGDDLPCHRTPVHSLAYLPQRRSLLSASTDALIMWTRMQGEEGGAEGRWRPTRLSLLRLSATRRCVGLSYDATSRFASATVEDTTGTRRTRSHLIFSVSTSSPPPAAVAREVRTIYEGEGWSLPPTAPAMPPPRPLLFSTLSGHVLLVVPAPAQRASRIFNVHTGGEMPGGSLDDMMTEPRFPGPALQYATYVDAGETQHLIAVGAAFISFHRLLPLTPDV